MHEMSLAGGIVDIVERAAREQCFRRVTVLRLEAGRLAAVEVPALQFALQAMTHGTCLEGARIDIEQPPGEAWCLGCDRTVQIESRVDACPHCGGVRLQPTGGTELRVLDLVVED